MNSKIHLLFWPSLSMAFCWPRWELCQDWTLKRVSGSSQCCERKSQKCGFQGWGAGLGWKPSGRPHTCVWGAGGGSHSTAEPTVQKTRQATSSRWPVGSWNVGSVDLPSPGPTGLLGFQLPAWQSPGDLEAFTILFSHLSPTKRS